jgi:hypothetical protein
MDTYSVAVRFTRKGSTSTNQVTEQVKADSQAEAEQKAIAIVKNRSRDAENVTATSRKMTF